MIWKFPEKKWHIGLHMGQILPPTLASSKLLFVGKHLRSPPRSSPFVTWWCSHFSWTGVPIGGSCRIFNKGLVGWVGSSQMKIQMKGVCICFLIVCSLVHAFK